MSRAKKPKPPPEPVKMGRKPSLLPDEETLLRVEGLGRIQCTQKEAAAVLGCDQNTFGTFLDKHENARIAWELGKENGRASLRRLQFKNAERGNSTMQIWLGKQYLDQKDKAEFDHTHKTHEQALAEIEAAMDAGPVIDGDVTPRLAH